MADDANVQPNPPDDAPADDLKLSLADGDPLSEFVDDVDDAGDGEKPEAGSQEPEGDGGEPLPAGEGGEDAPGGDKGKVEETPPAPGDGGGDPAGDGGKPPAWSSEVQQLQQQVANLTKMVQDAKASGDPVKVAEAVNVVKDELQEMSEQIEQRLADPNFDNFEHGPAVIKQQQAMIRSLLNRQRQLEGVVVENQQAVAAARENAVHETYWGQFARENPEIGRGGGEQLWAEAIAAVNADKSIATDDHRLGVATYIFNQKVAARKAVAAAAKTASKPTGSTKPPPTPAKVPAGGAPSSGGRLGFPAGRASSEPPKNLTLDEQVERGDFNLSESLGFV